MHRCQRLSSTGKSLTLTECKLREWPVLSNNSTGSKSTKVQTNLSQSLSKGWLKNSIGSWIIRWWSRIWNKSNRRHLLQRNSANSQVEQGSKKAKISAAPKATSLLARPHLTCAVLNLGNPEHLELPKEPLLHLQSVPSRIRWRGSLGLTRISHS